MADDAKIGTPWQDDDLDAIVADYFSMLKDQLSGRSYVKSAHSKALMARVGRTHRSVEFKHQNISAVLDELGMPWIPGYIPKRNYQRAIFGAIDRYLTAHPDILAYTRPSPPTPPSIDPFVDPPRLSASAREQIPDSLRHLIGKFDPVERDRRNRSLGSAGEQFVRDLECRRLHAAGRPDLAQKVRWVAADEGDAAGYDVLSFQPTGSQRLLEVKTTNGNARTPFFLTRNERALATRRPTEWQIYRVHLFAMEPRIFTLEPPLERTSSLAPETWRVSFYTPLRSLDVISSSRSSRKGEA